jgi:hypothetical protein
MGMLVDSLPPEHDTFVIGGRQYYYNAGVYYVESKRGNEARFVVVEPPESPSSPNPIRHVREMSDYLAALGSVSMTCSVARNERDVDEKDTAAPLEITIHRTWPNKLRADVGGEPGAAGVRCDGSRVSVFNCANGEYATVEQIEDFDAALKLLAELLGLPEAAFGVLSDDAFGALVTKTGTNDARYVGREDLENRLCHHLAFQSPTAHWDLWLELGDPPLPRRLLVDAPDGTGEAGYLVRITSWDASAEFMEDFFVFEPPGDMNRAADARGVLPGANSSPRADDSPGP